MTALTIYLHPKNGELKIPLFVPLCMEALFGLKDDLTLAQECARAGLIFFYGLLMLRLSGRRTFSQMSAQDLVVSLIVGSALGRALTGGAPFFGTLAAVAVLVALHVLVSHAVARSEFLSHLLEGIPVTLARHGQLDQGARRAHMISNNDLDEALRGEGLEGLKDISKIKSITLEPSGELSVVKESGG